MTSSGALAAALVALGTSFVPYSVTVTRSSATVDRFADSSSFQALFVVKNTGTLSDTYDLFCDGSLHVACISVSPTVATLSPNQQINVTITYRTTSTTGGGAWVRLTAESPNRVAFGEYDFSVWPKVPHAVSVTPANGIGPNRNSFTSGYTAAFTVKNVGLVRDSFNLFCQPAANITCSSQTLNATPGQNALDSSVVTVTYATGASGPGFVAFQAVSDFASATGTWNFAVVVGPSTAVAVTPDSQAIGVLPSVSATRPFTVRNPGTASSTYNVTATCTGSAIASGCTPSPTSLTVAAGASGTVTVSYTSGAANTTGRILLAAVHSQDPAVKDTGWVNVATGTAQRATILVADPSGPTLSRNLCLAVAIGGGAASECGDLRLAQALPAIRTLGRARVPTLEYSSAAAHPYPLVGANLSLPTGAANPDSVVVRLLVSQIQKARASWSGAGMSPGRTSRVVIGYDALSEASGITSYTLEAVSWFSGVAQPADTTTGQYVIVNRKDSPFGAGWWFAGLEQLNTTTMVWTGGDGSVRQYQAPQGQQNVWVGPNIDHPDTLKFDGTYYTRYLPDSVKVRFDVQGHHVATINRLGHTTTFHYRAAGLAVGALDTITVPPASATARYVFVYDTSVTPARLKAVVAPPAGAIARVDSVTVSSGKITAIRDPDSTIVNFGYDGAFANRINSRTDRRGTLANFTFDAAGKVTGSTLDPSGLGITTIIRPVESGGFASAALAAVLDTSQAYTLLDGPRTDVGDSTLYWLDRFGAPKRVRNALGAETAIARDATWPALAARLQAPNGRVMLAAYDTRGHLHTVTDSGTVVNGQVATTRYEWNMTWDAVERIVLPEQDSTVMSYGANGNRQWQQDGRGQISRTTFGYDPATGLLTSVRMPAAVKADSFHYDAVRSNLDTTLTPMGFRTVTFADALGRDTLVITPTDSAQTPSKVLRRRMVYDLADRVIQAWTIAPPVTYQLDLATSFVPDTTSITAETLFVTNAYDAEGNLASVESYTDPGLSENFDIFIRDYLGYDRANRLISRRLGSGPTSYSYDPAGNAIGQGYRNGKEITQTFDVLNRLTRRVIPSVDYSQTTCGDHTGPWTSPTCLLRFPLYPNNGSGYRVAADTSTFTYDVMGNMLEADNADSKISRTYGLNGTVQTDTQRVSYASFGIRYGYDRNGRRTWMRLPLVGGDSMTYGYNAVLGALSQIRDPVGRLISFVYDSAGRPDTMMTYMASGQPWGIRETSTLDPDGRVVRRIRSLSAGIVDIDSLRYDARGKLLEARTHNAAHGHTNDRTTLAYDGFGGVVGSETYSLAFNTWQTEEYRNDGLGNVGWKKSTTVAGAELPHIAQMYTFSGALLSTLERPPNPICANDAQRYDTLYQKVDLAGNVGIAGENTQHCAGGNYHWSQAAASRNFYRADNRLKVVQRYNAHEFPDSVPGLNAAPKDGTWEEYRYDALGRRVFVYALRDSLCYFPGRDCSDFDQTTVWDGDQVLAEVRTSSGGDPATSGTLVYVHGAGLDQPLEILDSRSGMDGRVPNYNWRGLAQSSRFADGSPADCTVMQGPCTTINWPAGSGVYVWTAPPPGGSPNPTWVGSLMADGQDGTGMHYRRNRYYDPASGRFTQEDPIGLTGGLNLYGFASGDPVTFTDPFGLAPGPCDRPFLGVSAKDFAACMNSHVGALPSAAAMFSALSFATGALTAAAMAVFGTEGTITTLGLRAAPATGIGAAAIDKIVQSASQLEGPGQQIFDAARQIGNLGLNQGSATQAVQDAVTKLGFDMGGTQTINGVNYVFAKMPFGGVLDAIAIDTQGAVTRAVFDPQTMKLIANLGPIAAPK